MRIRAEIVLWRRAALQAIALLAMLFAGPVATAFAQTSDFEDWQGFKAGSWSEVRTTVESMDSQGTSVASKSVSVTRTTLDRVGANSVTLRLQTMRIESNGTQVHAPAAMLELRPYGQQENEKLAHGQPEKAVIDVGGQRIEGNRLTAKLTSDHGSRDIVSTFRDGALHAPIRRVVTVYEADGKVRDTTTTEAVAIEGFATVAQRVVPTTHYRVAYKNHKLTSTSLVDKSVEVPGQLVRGTIAERETNGPLLRFVTQELVGFHAIKPEVSVREVKTRREIRRDRREGRQLRRSP
jgi:hypothetical protein